MPWTIDDPPPPARNWSEDRRRRCVRAANSVLEETGDDGQAIFACIRAAGMSENIEDIDGVKLTTLVDDDGKVVERFQTKTEDGVQFPPGDYAYVPDRERPSTWKLRLTSTPGGSPDPRIVGAAVAALGPGFRGQRVQIPAADLSAVKARVRGAWKRAHPDASDEDVPQAIRATESAAAKDYAEDLKSIQGVEIFRSGTWNGDRYTDADLDEMVGNFHKVGFEVPLKLGHKEVSGGEAFGWVAALRRAGDRLVADFRDVPAAIFAKIKARAFDPVSAEIFWDLVRNGQKFKRVLKAVALLGAETPAVSGLKPLRETFTADELRAVHSYTLHTEDFQMADDKQLDEMRAALEKAQDQIKTLQGKLDDQKDTKKGDDLALQIKAMKEEQDRVVKELAEAKDRERKAVVDGKLDKLRVPAFKDHFRALFEFVSIDPTKTVKFSTLDDKGNSVERDTPFVAVLDDLVERVNKAAEYLFSEHSTIGDWKRDDVQVTDDPGQEIDDLVKRHMAKHNEANYSVAFDAVLSDPDNSELKRRYAFGRN